MSINDVSPVDEYSNVIQAALAEAREAKTSGAIDPALASQDIHESIEKIQIAGRRGATASDDVRKDYAAIETACRDIFYKLLVSGFDQLAQDDR